MSRARRAVQDGRGEPCKPANHDDHAKRHEQARLTLDRRDSRDERETDAEQQAGQIAKMAFEVGRTEAGAVQHAWSVDHAGRTGRQRDDGGDEDGQLQGASLDTEAMLMIVQTLSNLPKSGVGTNEAGV